MSNLRHVNAIAGRLSLRAPQRRSLEILDRVTEIVPPNKTADLAAALEIIKSEFPGVTNFERDFPSLCFALATGVGKTRLMGAFITYLKLAHGINNFFVLAPNLTIYNKLIADFTANTPKYVFKGISEFAISPPVLTTGETYERQIASGGQLFPTTINIFNIAKISSEVRGGRSPRIRSFREEIGESYFDYLASLPDLVLLMDESHRYRATAGMRAINELKPVLGLELTATPFVEGARGPVPFSNVIFDYLRTDQVDVIGFAQANLLEERLEDYVVSGLIDFSDIAYDEHADLLYDLAGQVVAHLRSYLSEEEAGQVLVLHQPEIARAVHAQMQDHFWLDDRVEYHHEVRQGFPP